MDSVPKAGSGGSALTATLRRSQHRAAKQAHMTQQAAGMQKIAEKMKALQARLTYLRRENKILLDALIEIKDLPDNGEGGEALKQAKKIARTSLNTASDEC